MWRKFQIHLPPDKFDTQSQFCDWHKGQNLKKDGAALLSLARAERCRRGSTDYDDMHVLGPLLEIKSHFEHKFTTLFGPLLHVVRRHESALVATLFWKLFTDKASGCGLFAHKNEFQKLHHYLSGTSGRYGMSTFVTKQSGTTKYGCGITANSLEARANKHIKAALGTKLGFVAMHAIVKKSCSFQCRQTCHLRFSLRQACHGDCRKIYCNKESTQYGENPVGANWKQQWSLGVNRAGDDEYWNTYCWSKHTSWPLCQYTIATNSAVEVCRKMQLHYNDATKTTRDYCATLKQDWLSFRKDPMKFRDALVAEVQTFSVDRARDHLVNRNAYPDAPRNWRPSEADVFAIVEKDLLFQQQVT
jgi:hypothetical protein